MDTWDGTEAARKALSAALRTGQRFGVNHLIDVLRGADERAHRAGSATTGCRPSASAPELDANAWRSVFRQLVARGYLRVDMERVTAP